jgi:peptide/nickel transport system substrate-binding protein
MMRRRFRGGAVMFLSLLMLLTACAPSAAPGQQAAAPRSAQTSSTPKSLTVAIQVEPPNFDTSLTGVAGNPNAGGQSNVRPIAHDRLTVQDENSIYRPQLVTEKPSIENNTWRVNATGGMEMVWKLKPGVKWHDGAPFSADDMLFTFEVRQDPALPRSGTGGGRPDLMLSASAPDPLTFVVQWSEVYVRADEASGLEPLPRHILEEPYRRNKESVVTSRYFTTEFVGLGAYKLERWEPGSHMEFVRFADYHRGPAKLDRLIVKFVPDSNAMITNILAGAVDVVLPEGVELDAALELRRRWQGTRNQVRIDVLAGLEHFEVQHRPEFAQPRNGFTVRTVRQALYQGLDRNALAEAMTEGTAPAADSWYAPNDPVRKDVEAFIPQFPYDPPRALRLFEESGWVRGGDGVLVHQTTGERFQTSLQVRPGSEPQKAGQIVADQWKALGVQLELDVLSGPRMRDQEYLAHRPGLAMVSPSGYNFYDRRLHSERIPKPENRWTGNNRGGYANERVDAILDRLSATINPTERIGLHRDLLREMMGDVALMPLYWQVVPILMVEGVVGPKMQSNEATHNIWEWDRT